MFVIGRHKLWLAAGLALLALSIVGCGDTGASEEELAEEYNRGERTGRVKALASAEHRVKTAHAHGFIDGMNWEDRMSKRVDEEIEGEEIEEEEAAYAGSSYINPTPMKENGEPSYEFEPEDIERAEEAPTEVQEYCEGAVSEAQEVGCLSHVEPSEVP